MMMFGGSPIRVAAPPMLDASTSAIRNGWAARSIAKRLRPDALEDLGLHSALSALCTEFTQATGISVVKHIAAQNDRLPHDVELVCYRVAQESLTNIARHADAGKVWLDLHTTVDQLTLPIADD